MSPKKKNYPGVRSQKQFVKAASMQIVKQWQFLLVSHKLAINSISVQPGSCIFVRGGQSTVLNAKVSKSVRMSRRGYPRWLVFFSFLKIDCTVRVFQRPHPAAINKTPSSPVASIFSCRALCLELSASFNPLLSAKADKVACCVPFPRLC